jgi:serine/threonine-protein kinase
MTLEGGYEIGGCRILRQIAVGSMAEIYLAEQLRLGNRMVAVKIVHPEGYGLDREHIDRATRLFEREATLLGQLAHPNILPVFDFGVADGLLYLVMEYMPDGSLADVMRDSGKFRLPLPATVSFTLHVIGQIGDALQFVHDHGVVYRDVKPSNVLVRVQPDGLLKALLADFGVAHIADAENPNIVAGTFSFMAPEMLSGSSLAASDQYALGLVTFWLLGGRLPFEGDLAALTRSILFDAPPSLRGLNPLVGVEVEEVVVKALAKHPSDRWPSVAAFVQALRSAAQGTLALDARVFISYRRSDSQHVVALASKLTAQGYRVWFDQELVGGEEWWDTILTNIRLSDVFIFALTPASLQSEPCRLEYEWAHGLRKRILPVLLEDGVDFRVLSPALQQIQVVDYRQPEDRGWRLLVSALGNLPAATALPDPLPQPPAVPISPVEAMRGEFELPTVSGTQQLDLLHRLGKLLTRTKRPKPQAKT